MISPRGVPLSRDGLARAALLASGLAAAVPALLPALLVGLIALFDVSARALLGTSGSLLGVAGALLPGSGTLPRAARIGIDPAWVAGVSLARFIPPACMVAVASRPRRTAALVAALAALGSDGTLGAVAAAPGAGAALALMRRTPPPAQAAPGPLADANTRPPPI